jgi:ppGpp synthetase/RelA/SpoT-type nucleotidyltranferase
MTSLADAREQYLGLRPFYAELIAEVKALLASATRTEGINADITARTKDVSQVLRKLITKPRALDEVPDLGGVRACVLIPEDAATIRACIERVFVVHKFEDKRVQMSPTALGYYGQHFDVSLHEDDAMRISARARGLRCELQVHTRAHNLWADFSHDVTYKSQAKLPDEVVRRVYRLVALLDLVDSEIQASRDAAVKTPGFEEGAMLVALERLYFELTGKQHDAELSLYIVSGLKGLYNEGERRAFAARIDDFVNSQRERLLQRYAQYGDDDRVSPLLFQPEALMVLERLEANSFALKEAWAQILPIDLLTELADVWGTVV